MEPAPQVPEAHCEPKVQGEPLALLAQALPLQLPESHSRSNLQLEPSPRVRHL